MIKHFCALRVWPEVKRRKDFYSHPKTHSERLAEQMRRFNLCWSTIRFNIPYYKQLAIQRDLPARFRSWEEIIDFFPIMDRKTIQEQGKSLSDQTKAPQWYRITGGSTAQPVQLPAWKSENDHTSPDMWLARSWYGIKPTDKLFMIWGHSHLLGSGLHGLVNQYLREFKDRLLGYNRFSAYNMNVQSMQAAAEALVLFRPKYMIGYSVALDAFARTNMDKLEILHDLGLKAVIGAAEGFPSEDSVEQIVKVTGAPVAMEYGSVETNLIAHTHPDGDYHVFWQTYFVEALDDGRSGGKKILVTSLYPRCFPLIRYEIGDEIVPHPSEPGLGIERFERVIGRCNDYIVLRDGARVHSELITHAIRLCPEITGYQVIQKGYDICLTFTSLTELTSETVKGIKRRLAKIHPEFEDISVERALRLHQTIAGKTPIVLRKDVGEENNISGAHRH